MEHDPWKSAVMDALSNCWAYRSSHENNPRRAIAALIASEVAIALDPAVSEDARKLIKRAKRGEFDGEN
jgi:hypothetical protein